MNRYRRCNADSHPAALGRCWLKKGHRGRHAGWFYTWKREKPKMQKLAKKRRQIIKKIIANLTDDLRRKPWKGARNPVAGHCYVASEVFYHLSGGKKSGLTPMRMKMGDWTHWYLRTKKGKYIDITKSQFKMPVQHHYGIGYGFLTSKPSKRAMILINRIMEH